MHIRTLTDQYQKEITAMSRFMNNKVPIVIKSAMDK